jgi:hypothetical protein
MTLKDIINVHLAKTLNTYQEYKTIMYAENKKSNVIYESVVWRLLLCTPNISTALYTMNAICD